MVAKYVWNNCTYNTATSRRVYKITRIPLPDKCNVTDCVWCLSSFLFVRSQNAVRHFTVYIIGMINAASILSTRPLWNTLLRVSCCLCFEKRPCTVLSTRRSFNAYEYMITATHPALCAHLPCKNKPVSANRYNSNEHKKINYIGTLHFLPGNWNLGPELYVYSAYTMSLLPAKDDVLNSFVKLISI